MRPMAKLILVYITYKDSKQAQQIGKHLMRKRLVACTNVFTQMHSQSFWPPKSGKIENAQEVVLIAKTLQAKWNQVEKEVLAIHSYDTPCILAIPVTNVTKKYYAWLLGELGP